MTVIVELANGDREVFNHVSEVQIKEFKWLDIIMSAAWSAEYREFRYSEVAKVVIEKEEV